MKTSDTSTEIPKDPTSSVEGSRAKTFPTWVTELVSMVRNPAYGLNSAAAYAFFSPSSSLPKTFQRSLLPGEEWSTFSESFTRAGMVTSGGIVCQLPPLMPLTKETGSSLQHGGPNSEGLWPTPLASGDHATMFKQGGMPLGVAVRMREPGDVTPQMGINPDWVEWLLGFGEGFTMID